MSKQDEIAVDKVAISFRGKFSDLIADSLAQLPAHLEKAMMVEVVKGVGECVGGKKYQERLPLMRTNYGTKPTEALPDFLSITPQP